MEELLTMFNTITWCLKQMGVVKDVRRLILSIYIFDEFQSRHYSNCVGPVYQRLSSISLSFSRSYNSHIVVAENIDYVEGSPISPILLTRDATMFILESGLLSKEQLPLNHPSEQLGIMTKITCTYAVLTYILRNKLINEEDKRFVTVNDNLMPFWGEHDPTLGTGRFLVVNGKERLHRSFGNLIQLQESFTAMSRPRWITEDLRQILNNNQECVKRLMTSYM